jgi:Protein of unknown function (DUF2914)
MTLMNSNAITVTMSLAALVFSGVSAWRADSHASTRDARPVAVRAPVVTPVAAPAAHAPVPVTVVPAVAAPAVVALAAPVAGLEVRRIAVGTGIENREVVGHASEYELTRGQRFCAMVEAVNVGAPRRVRVRFEHDGDAAHSVGFVSLAVPRADRYRTWGCTERVQTPGTWSAVVETADGHELARDVFTVR